MLHRNTLDTLPPPLAACLPASSIPRGHTILSPRSFPAPFLSVSTYSVSPPPTPLALVPLLSPTRLLAIFHPPASPPSSLPSAPPPSPSLSSPPPSPPVLSLLLLLSLHPSLVPFHPPSASHRLHHLIRLAPLPPPPHVFPSPLPLPLSCPPAPCSTSPPFAPLLLVTPLPLSLPPATSSSSPSLPSPLHSGLVAPSSPSPSSPPLLVTSLSLAPLPLPLPPATSSSPPSRPPLHSARPPPSLPPLPSGHLRPSAPPPVPPPGPSAEPLSARSGDRKVKFREMKVAPAARKVKGFSLVDSRLQKGNWKEQPNRLEIQQFLRILAVCHTVVPEIEESTGKVKYEAESPDESAFVVAARELGMELRRRTEGSIFIEEPSDDFQTMVESEYKILALIEFNSTRKRMTMIVRMPNSKIQLMCKGADSVIYERLGAKGKQYAPTTFQHLEVFGQAGLRTLALSYRELSEEEYASWAARWKEARTVIGPSRDARIDAEAEFIEVDLVLAGATGIEDKLQKGVPETIDRLAKAGLKIWVLTGDKVETAINIGYATSLLRRGMTQIMIELTDPAIKAAEDAIDKKKIEELSVASIGKQLDDGLKQIRLNEDPDAVFALIIDGKSLAYALEEWARERFLTMAVSCASVLCCRVSPRQKAQVTELVKIGTGAVTLGVGDGANDVGMIQAADIGVGISGVEGMQAVMASDFSIGQFRFLEKLLLVHGHWCYKRIAFMVSYFFYKNITFGLTLFYFNAFAFFSGQTLYNSYYLALYNVFFTSIPVIVIGILEQDVSKRACLSFPILYRQGARNTFFNWGRIGLWAANGVYGSIINCLFVLGAYWYTAASSDGRTAGLGELGTIMYTTIVWTVNLQMAASINYWTIFHHLAVWGSIGLWYLFVVVYGALSVTFSEDAHKVFVETTAPSAKYWLVTLLVPVSCIFPYLAFYGWQRWFNPQDHQIVQEAELLVRKKKLDPELFHSSTMHIPASHGVGFTAAVDHQMKRIQRKMARRKRRGKKTRAL